MENWIIIIKQNFTIAYIKDRSKIYDPIFFNHKVTFSSINNMEESFCKTS